MSGVLDILTRYHADKISKQQAAAEIEELIDAERLTYLDDMAGRAMQGICAHNDTWGEDSAGICVHSYRIAKFMAEECAK